MDFITGLILHIHTTSLPCTAPAWLNYLPTTWISWPFLTLKPPGTSYQDLFARPCLLGTSPARWELLWAAPPGLLPLGNVCSYRALLGHASLRLQLLRLLRWGAETEAWGPWSHCSSAPLQASRQHPVLSSLCSLNLLQHVLKVPAAIWRAGHLAVGQMLWSASGEWGQMEILERRKSRDKEGRSRCCRQSLGVWLWTQCGWCCNSSSMILKYKAGSRVLVARQSPWAPKPCLLWHPEQIPTQAKPMAVKCWPGEPALPNPAQAHHRAALKSQLSLSGRIGGAQQKLGQVGTHGAAILTREGQLQNTLVQTSKHFTIQWKRQSHILLHIRLPAAKTCFTSLFRK